MTDIGRRHVNGLVDAFKEIPEYRKNLLNVDHQLHDIIALCVVAVVAGADGPSDIHEWAELHEKELVVIMGLEHGIPSRDTIRRTLQAIKPEAFQKCFLEWTNAFRVNNEHGKEHVAVDGKTLRRSHDKKNNLASTPRRRSRRIFRNRNAGRVCERSAWSFANTRTRAENRNGRRDISFRRSGATERNSLGTFAVIGGSRIRYIG